MFQLSMTTSASTASHPQLSEVAKEIMDNARRMAHKTDSYSDGDTLDFRAEWDHILSSQCRHPPSSTLEDDGTECVVCIYERELKLPHLPEMIFPRNSLEIRWRNHPNAVLSFNALDALKMVDTHNLPGVQVAPSSLWQESRAQFPDFKQFAHPFDWTYTTEYAGTAEGLKTEETEDSVDLERLKKQEAILFYAQVPLYEDELADHGCASLSVRLRVMPSCSFALQRFYLRVDDVIPRICDTRVFALRGESSVLVEWTCEKHPQLPSLISHRDSTRSEPDLAASTSSQDQIN
ncbi:hypothetical protein PMAYCL1PPCAC_29646 [Pristionchus mayeri]|uniref:TIP41-like protein n=1 Tax=Pristionchus mayeri TaxID=1317129 RepID=A0AAN5D9U1_9BILA|nr:hypothetical protein PMAYCL1PPCAC_29646 [Pristionchus mayeri]